MSGVISNMWTPDTPGSGREFDDAAGYLVAITAGTAG
jgi:hypothetical protein